MTALSHRRQLAKEGLESLAKNVLPWPSQPCDDDVDDDVDDDESPQAKRVQGTTLCKQKNLLSFVSRWRFGVREQFELECARHTRLRLRTALRTLVKRRWSQRQLQFISIVYRTLHIFKRVLGRRWECSCKAHSTRQDQHSARRSARHEGHHLLLVLVPLGIISIFLVSLLLLASE